MAQLTVKDIIDLFLRLSKKYPEKEVLQMPIYIGNDDELNGIHCAWYRQLIDVNDEDDKDLIEMINDDCNCIKIKDKAILIS